MTRVYPKIGVLTQASLYFCFWSGGGGENESFGAGVADGRSVRILVDR